MISRIVELELENGIVIPFSNSNFHTKFALRPFLIL